MAESQVKWQLKKTLLKTGHTDNPSSSTMATLKRVGLVGMALASMAMRAMAFRGEQMTSVIAFGLTTYIDSCCVCVYLQLISLTQTSLEKYAVACTVGKMPTFPVSIQAHLVLIRRLTLHSQCHSRNRLEASWPWYSMSGLISSIWEWKRPVLIQATKSLL